MARLAAGERGEPRPLGPEGRRTLVRPLARTPVTPNQLTVLSLAVALTGAGMMATGRPGFLDLGALLFVLGRFLDHFDGELARQTGRGSRFGYYFDYVAGALSYAGFYVGAGWGLAGGALGAWAPALGAVGATAAIVAMPLNLGIDALDAGRTTGEAVGYPAGGGFEMEDAMYLVAPITWLGLLDYFLAVAAPGAVVYALWTAGRLLRRTRRRA